jgi:hypothetical protein
MPVGICPMCQGEGKLCESHFMPHSLYRICTSPGFEPVRISKTAMYPTSKQTKDHLLCNDCEQNLSKNGEDWVLPLLPRIDTGFPLLDRVRKQAPIYDDGVRQLYGTSLNPEVDSKKLLHFVCGIFWKGAVHSWKGAGGPTVLDLGEYAESLRRFLRGEADLPVDVAVAVSLDNAPKRLIGFIEPYRVQIERLNGYCFFVPGIVANLYTGAGAQQAYIAQCLNANTDRPIMVEELSKLMRNTSRIQTASARKSKKLLENQEEIKKRGLSIRLGE